MTSLIDLIEPMPGELDPMDRAWAAGFLEGEGYFAFHTRSHTIQVAQVNSEPLAKLKRIFGGSISYREKRARQNNDFFLWKAHGETARKIMWTIYDLMSEKRQEQIREALLHSTRPQIKLTEAQIQDILSQGSSREIAKRYGVSPQYVSRLRRANGWSR